MYKKIIKLLSDASFVWPSQNIKESATQYRAVKIVGGNALLIIYTIHTNNCL